MGYQPQDIELQRDVLHRMLIGTGVGLGVVALLSLGPWLLAGSLLAIGIAGGRWWVRHGKYKDINPAEKRTILDTRGISYFDIEKKTLMYLGTTEENTIRWWYGGGEWIMPQAIDDGKFYWSKRVEVKDKTLLKHLRGFYEMGNEWPEYYKLTAKKEDKKVYKRDKSKKSWVNAAMVQYPTSFAPEVIKAVESDLPRADYTDGESAARPTTAAMASDAPLMELIESVKDLEMDATGRCPTIQFEEMK